MPYMNPGFEGRPPAEWLSENPAAAEIRQIREFLEQRGTFRFPVLPNGLFSAAAGEGGDFELTGYRNVWVRDNIQIAWAHLAARNDVPTAIRCVQSIAEFWRRHSHRFTAILDGQADPADPMHRPHIRFNGTDLTELPEKWAHAQNDALGYWLWLTCELVARGALPAKAAPWDVIALLIHFWIRIEVWQDEDSGHWEEVRKVAASSIGCALAGLTALGRLLDQPEISKLLEDSRPAVQICHVEPLRHACRAALTSILPAECTQADPVRARRYDAALVFLIYPLNIIRDPGLEDQILADISQNLTGQFGIRRYLGDSYWCADYRELLSADQRTADFSDDLDARDRLLKPGMEAQWCIFDPIIACIHGRRAQISPEEIHRTRMLAALRRSLSQLTKPGDRFAPYQCPESWFCEKGRWIPNDITPLLWTQGNLMQALAIAEKTV